jgi:hypothetical protein
MNSLKVNPKVFRSHAFYTSKAELQKADILGPEHFWKENGLISPLI